MKQSCAGNMIRRQVKQKMARVKLRYIYIYIYIYFHLKFVKMKKIFTVLALKQSNSDERIFALYKYSRRLLIKTVSPKFLSNNLFVMTFLWPATPSRVLIFSNLILHNVILVSKKNSSVFKLFVFLQIRCAKLKIRQWICVSIRHTT